ncbi:hypothetical protein AB0M38_31710 [Streptomyces sp. NPDC051742]|uniref:hypothetical protein n=1 Tax=unclassified Streptomyces TaxID=2593676 RepID=UPI00342D5E95
MAVTAARLAERIAGIGIRIDYAPLPMLQRLPHEQWTWQAIGRPDGQAQPRAS